MALLTPQVTKLTVAVTGHTTGAKTVAALYAHYNAGTSTKFDLVANGHAATGFTLTPKGSDTWHLNIRPNGTAASAHVSIDPKAGITASGDATTAPTITSDTEWSTEQATPGILFSGTMHDDFYLIELADCIIILFMDTGKTHTPYITLAGRVYVPWFTDGVNGDDYADGLGILGGKPYPSASSGFIYSHTSSGTRLRMHQEYVSAAGDQWWKSYYTAPSPTSTYDVNGKKKLGPHTYLQGYTTLGGTRYKVVGYSKYQLRPHSAQLPGVVLDGGAGNDAWVHINYNNGSRYHVVPWDRNLLPDF
jgi:hypothetical protein